MSIEKQDGNNLSRKKLSTIESQNWLKKMDETNLRRLWLLVQYQEFRSWATFTDAVHILKEQFKLNNKITETYWTPPNKRQVLGKMHELKSREFVEFWKSVQRETGMDIFHFAATAPLSTLYSENHIFNPLESSSLKPPKTFLKDPSLPIPLPLLLEREFKTRIPRSDGSTTLPPM